MMRIFCHVAGSLLAFCLFSIHLAAQDIAPTAPQKLTLHSKTLNEDRVVWIRTPQNYEKTQGPFPVLYLVDGPAYISLVADTMDILALNDRMPPVLIVGIANTDRTRDMTPSHADEKNPDGTVHADPTSGGADHFVDFIRNELMPEIERRYRVAPFRVFVGHSFGGLLAVHMLITRPDLFQAYIAASPSLWWDNESALHQAQDFFAAHAEFNKRFFFDLGSKEGGEMRNAFNALQRTLTVKTPKDFHWKSAVYPDDDHGTSVLRGYNDGLREIFFDWHAPTDPDGKIVGGLQGVEAHYRELSARYGYEISAEGAINRLGYQLLADKKVAEAIVVFKRNVDLYPASANVYDSLADGYEADSKLDLATKNAQKAVEVGTKIGDWRLGGFKEHLKRLIAKANASGKPKSQGNLF